MEVPGSIIGLVIEVIRASVKYFANSNKIPEQNLTEKINSHLVFVKGWSEQLQFYELTEPVPVKDFTIALRINAKPRQFQPQGIDPEQLDEVDLLADSANYVILGDPGSGKTTTLRRIAGLLLKAPSDREAGAMDYANYPIVIRAGDITDSALTKVLSDVVGIPYEGTHSARLVFDFLHGTRPLILVDAIDELPKERTVPIEKELADLAQSTGCKIIATCRSGDFARQIEGFHIVEIAALTPREASRIIGLWTKKPKDFLDLLVACPYADIVTRPLFLTQLIVIFNNTGNLPARPSDIYKKIITLMLDKWDKGRSINRKSRYSRFDADQKLEFLASLSFFLTYKTQKKQFCTDDLVSVYREIHERFSLPANEAEAVAEEIESHTGVIARSSPSDFEFSHLSLQEYLAAHYLVREPRTSQISNYLYEYPAPVAIAVALSSRPSEWFGELVLRSIALKGEAIPTAIVKSLTRRVILECPYFSVSLALGLGVLKLFSDFGNQSDQAYWSSLKNPNAQSDRHKRWPFVQTSDDLYSTQFIEELLNYRNVKESIILALQYYFVDLRKKERRLTSRSTIFWLDKSRAVTSVEAAPPESFMVWRNMFLFFLDMPEFKISVAYESGKREFGLREALAII